MRTNFLLAGHGPRRPSRPVSTEKMARRIVASLRAHPERVPEFYSTKPETLAAVATLLNTEASHAE